MRFPGASFEPPFMNGYGWLSQFHSSLYYLYLEVVHYV
jgi:hypothetical protein